MTSSRYKVADFLVGLGFVLALSIFSTRTVRAADPPTADLAAWFKADAGITKDGNDNVSAWADQSVNGRDATQAEVPRQPLWVDGVVNGKPVVRFDGTDDFLGFDLDPNGLTGLTIFVVSACSEDVSSGQYSHDHSAVWWGETASWGGIPVTPLQSEVGARFGTKQTENVMKYTRPAKLTETDFTVTMTMHDGTSATDSIYVDSVQVVEQTGKLSALAGCKSTPRLGANDWASITCFPGDIAEVLVYEAALSDTDRQAVEQYLDVRYFGPEISISSEGTDEAAEAGPAAGAFTVTRTGSTEGAITLDMTVSGSASLQGSPPDCALGVDAAQGVLDLDSSPSTLTVNDGVESVTITVTPEDDDEVEGPEEVIIEILPGAGYSVGAPAEATVTIADDDVPGAFEAVYPPDEAGQIPTTLTLEWKAPAAPAADSYTVIVAGNEQLQNPIVDSVTQAGLTYDITAAHGLTENMQVWWTVTATNKAGTTEITGGPLTFWTHDTTPPRVHRTEPAAGDDRVDVSTTVRIRFSEEIQVPGTDEYFSFVEPGGAPVPGEWKFTHGSVLTFTPEGDLEYDTVYTVTVAADLADLAGNQLDVSNDPSGAGVSYVFSFTTFEPLVGLAAGEGCAPGAGVAVAIGGAWAVVASLAWAVRRPSSSRRRRPRR